MSRKFALIIGNTEYTDPGLAQLTAPGKDAEDFARVLGDKDICAFDDVNLIVNQPEYIVRGTIDEFFDQKKPDDLLVLYFSGHGVRDELGFLYLAVQNTIRTRLRSTGIKSDYIREAMDQSRSKRQVLILDCCNSGAFAQGVKAATGVSVGTASAFEAGYGRVILTASDSTQFAWEGDKVIGDTNNSLFTHFLVEGLEGKADLDSDGRITVDELYDYAYEQVKLTTSKQTPSKFSSKQQGEIVLRQITRMEDIRPVSLPDYLISEIENPYPEVRLRAVEQLSRLLNGKNLGLARSAREALERIEKEDDSRRVFQAATQVLEPIRQAEHTAEQEKKAKEEAARKAQEEAESIAFQKAEEQLAEQADADQKVKGAHVAHRKTPRQVPQGKKKTELRQRVTQPGTGNKQSSSSPNIQREITDKIHFFLPLWHQGVIWGAVSGLLLGLINHVFFSIYFRIALQDLFRIILDYLFFILAAGLAGYLTYPSKLSIVFLVGGFLVAGIVGYAIALDTNTVPEYLPFNFLAFGTILGLPAGALIFRILYGPKTIK